MVELPQGTTLTGRSQWPFQSKAEGRAHPLSLSLSPSLFHTFAFPWRKQGILCRQEKLVFQKHLMKMEFETATQSVQILQEDVVGNSDGEITSGP